MNIRVLPLAIAVTSLSLASKQVGHTEGAVGASSIAPSPSCKATPATLALGGAPLADETRLALERISDANRELIRIADHCAGDAFRDDQEAALPEPPHS